MILYLCASAGMNVPLSQKLLEIGQSLGGEHELINLVDLNLPLFSTVEEKANGVPQSVIELSKKVTDAEAFVFIAPEYNGGMPPVLNNAIAWVSRSGNDDWREAFNKSFAALATHSGGGGDKVLVSMRQMLQHLGCNVLSRQLLTHYQKQLNEESALAVLSELKEVAKA